jgi:hypothetical protein
MSYIQKMGQPPTVMSICETFCCALRSIYGTVRITRQEDTKMMKCTGHFTTTITGIGDRTHAVAANIRTEITYRCDREPGHSGPCVDYDRGQRGYWAPRETDPPEMLRPLYDTIRLSDKGWPAGAGDNLVHDGQRAYWRTYYTMLPVRPSTERGPGSCVTLFRCQDIARGAVRS